MKIILTIGFISIIAFFSHSQVRIISFYFQKNTSTLTSSSEKKIDAFNKLKLKNEVQVIEINGYIEEESTGEPSIESIKRIQFILNTFEFTDELLSINNFGLNHEPVPFKVKNWDRVDLYIFQGEEKKVPAVSVNKIDVDELNKTKTVETTQAAEIENRVKKKDVFLSSVKFFGGTKEIKSGSGSDLIALKDTLVKNPFLTVEIRGHVCCEDQMKLSRQRAKTIYKYLIKEGIDSKRLTYKGYSNYLPLAFPEIYEADREQNRRVDVVFTIKSKVVKKKKGTP